MKLDGVVVIPVDAVLDFLIAQGQLKGKEFIPRNPEPTGHGSCCTCVVCGYFHDDCVCDHNALLESLMELVEAEG